MPVIEDRLVALGLVLPVTGAIEVPFAWVRVFQGRVIVSGHGPLQPDGSPAGPFGRVPDQVSPEQGRQSARLAALSIMASVRDAVGDLDRIEAWLSVTGFIQAEPGYQRTTEVMHGLTEVVHDVFGEAGRHARTAIGVAALPLNLPVIAAAELHLRE